MTPEAARLRSIRASLDAIAPGEWSRACDDKGEFVESRGPMGELLPVARFHPAASLPLNCPKSPTKLELLARNNVRQERVEGIGATDLGCDLNTVFFQPLAGGRDDVWGELVSKFYNYMLAGKVRHSVLYEHPEAVRLGAFGCPICQRPMNSHSFDLAPGPLRRRTTPIFSFEAQFYRFKCLPEAALKRFIRLAALQFADATEGSICFIRMFLLLAVCHVLTKAIDIVDYGFWYWHRLRSSLGYIGGHTSGCVQVWPTELHWLEASDRRSSGRSATGPLELAPSRQTAGLV